MIGHNWHVASNGTVYEWMLLDGRFFSLFPSVYTQSDKSFMMVIFVVNNLYRYSFGIIWKRAACFLFPGKESAAAEQHEGWQFLKDDIFYFWLGFKTKLLSHTVLITQEQSASNLVQKFWRSKSMRKWLKDPPCPSFPNYLSSHGRYEPEKWRVFVRHLTLPFVWDLWCEKEKRALACSFVWYQDGERTLTPEGFLLTWNCAPGKGQLWGQKINRI